MDTLKLRLWWKIIVTKKRLLVNLLHEARLKHLHQKILWKELVIFISIVGLASIVRFWGVGDIGFNSDESVYTGQAANLAGYEEFSKYFSAFRAHPLLFQFLVSVIYGFTGVIDFVARIVSAIFGIMTVIITYYIGKTLYDKKVGILSSLILALLPYHIIVTRQAMVDVPFSFFFTLTLLFIAKYIVMNKNRNGNVNESNKKGIITIIRDIFETAIISRWLSNAKLKGDNNQRNYYDIIRDSFNISNIFKNRDYKKKYRIWVFAIGISCGLTFLSKEVGIVTFISTIVYMQFVGKWDQKI